jgi:CheY-like chemotaxis protein
VSHGVLAAHDIANRVGSPYYYRVYVLVVEDDQDIRSSLRDVLESEGLKTYTATNGREAVQFLEAAAELPSLILLDLMMPVMDGWEFLEWIKIVDSPYREIPIYVVSAVVSPEVRQQVSGVIRKPVDLTDLLGLVEKYCQPATPLELRAVTPN